MHPDFWFNTLLHSNYIPAPTKNSTNPHVRPFMKAQSFDVNKKVQIIILPYPEFKVPFGSFGFPNISHDLLNLRFVVPQQCPPNPELAPHGRQKHFGHTKGDLGTWRMGGFCGTPTAG